MIFSLSKTKKIYYYVLIIFIFEILLNSCIQRNAVPVFGVDSQGKMTSGYIPHSHLRIVMNDSINHLKNDVMFTIKSIPDDPQERAWQMSAFYLGLNLSAKGSLPVATISASTAMTLVFRYY